MKLLKRQGNQDKLRIAREQMSAVYPLTEGIFCLYTIYVCTSGCGYIYTLCLKKIHVTNVFDDNLNSKRPIVIIFGIVIT